MLADCVALIATGRACAVMSQAENQTAEQKRILAVLVRGDSVICFDNIDREFGGAAISQVLTQATITDRVLGFSRMVTAPTAATFLATGNNLTFAGDITCRVVPCDIDPQMEHPETRKFARNLYEWIPQHRGRLVAAALTIMRGFQAAGKPDQKVPAWAGFDAWSRMVREAVVWAGFADPAGGRHRLEETDPVRVQLATLLTAWHKHVGDDAITAGDAVQRCKVEHGYHDPPDKAELREALLAVAGFRDTIDAGRLGRYLRDSRNRIEAGLLIKRDGERHSVALWRVVKTNGSGGDGGNGGIYSNHTRDFVSDKKGIVIGNNPPDPPLPPLSDEREPGDDPVDF